MITTKKILAFLMASVSLAGVAHADAALVGKGAVQSMDVEFTQGVNATNTLTQVDGLDSEDMPKGTILANGTVAASDKGEHKYAIAVSNGEESENSWIVKGEDTKNTIKVYVSFTENEKETKLEKNVKIHGKNYTTGTADSAQAKYMIRIDGDGTPPVDNYTIDTKAYVYTE